MGLQFAFLSQFLLQLVVLSAVFIALYDIAKHTFHTDSMLALCGAVCLLDLIGYAAFWVAFANYAVFSVIKIIALALLLIRFALVIYWRRLPSLLRQVGEPLLYVFLFSGVVLTLGFSNGGLDAPTSTAAIRFSHQLPPDNIIPMILAEGLSLSHIPSPLLGDWLSSDRPPLQTGLYIALAIQTGAFGYQIVASWLQATLLFGVWAVAVAVDLPTRARRLVVLACCLVPDVIINTFFTWPKLITVDALMLIFVLLFCYRAADEREQKIAGVMLGGLTAFAMLSHGSSAFALIGLAATVFVAWRCPTWKTLLYAIPSLAVLYGSWIAYQTFVDPPGNRLLKWHLAGVNGKVDARGFLQALHDAYGALSWNDYVHGRWINLLTQVGPWPRHLLDLVRAIVSPNPDLLRSIRVNDFFYLVPSLHIFSIGVIVALVFCLIPRLAWRRQKMAALLLFAASAWSCLAAVVLDFIPGSAVNHQSTYAVQVMAVTGAFIMLSLNSLPLAIAFIALQTITVATVYGITLPYDPSFLPMQLSSIAATTAIFAYSLIPLIRPQIGTGSEIWPAHDGDLVTGRQRR